MGTATVAYRWRHPLRGRNPDETHRAATPLELFYDLVFVIAIAQAALGLHHGIAENHVAEAVINYVVVFFAIWWAWMSFTWFASSYDNDDVPYRLGVFAQLTGAVLLAAGVGRVFEDRDFTIVLIGYVIMRIAAVGQILRAAKHNQEERATEYKGALSLIVMQALWIALIVFMPKVWVIPGAVVLGAMELITTALVNQSRQTRNWHREHISERYGLLTIIVLGETFLVAAIAVQYMFDQGVFDASLLPLLIGGLLTVFAMWWLYFDEDASYLLDNAKTAYMWGYGHYVIFAAAAAVGAGLAVALDVATHHAHVTATVGAMALAIPVAVYVLAVWFLQERPSDSNDGKHLPYGALLLLITPWLPEPVLAVGVLLYLMVAVKVTLRHRAASVSSAQS